MVNGALVELSFGGSVINGATKPGYLLVIYMTTYDITIINATITTVKCIYFQGDQGKINHLIFDKTIY